jgi:hypothetical protein
VQATQAPVLVLQWVVPCRPLQGVSVVQPAHVPAVVQRGASTGQWASPVQAAQAPSLRQWTAPVPLRWAHSASPAAVAPRQPRQERVVESQMGEVADVQCKLLVQRTQLPALQ